MSRLPIKECMSVQYKPYALVFALLTALTLPLGAAKSQEASQTKLSGQVQHPDAVADPVKTCMAAQSEQPKPVSTKKGPIKVVTKALAKEFSVDSKNMLR